MENDGNDLETPRQVIKSPKMFSIDGKPRTHNIF